MPTKGGGRRAANRAFTEARRREAKPVATVLEPLSSQPVDMRGRYEDWKLNRLHRYRLTQRLERRTYGNGWFNNKFTLDYMGSAEFEFGASHESLNRMHAAGDFEIREVAATLRGIERIVYFVGSGNGEHRESLDRKIHDFQVWLDEGLRGKEYSEFEEPFTGDFGWRDPKYFRTIAWWSFDVDIMWTLDRSIAEELLYGLQHPATKN